MIPTEICLKMSNHATYARLFLRAFMCKQETVDCETEQCTVQKPETAAGTSDQAAAGEEEALQPEGDTAAEASNEGGNTN